jgi:hypothetical protein
VVEFQNGVTFIYPTELAEGLAGAPAAALSEVNVTPSGSGLRWPQLNVDFSLPALMRGAFGSRKWMRALAHKNDNAQIKPATIFARSNRQRQKNEKQTIGQRF